MPTGREPSVVVIGDVMSDVIVRPQGPVVRGADRRAAIRVVPGGSAANLAAWLAYAGAAPVLVGRVGREDHGRQVELLRRAGIGPVLAVDADAPTGMLVALIAPDGERSFLTDRGANERLQRSDLPDALLERADLVHVSGYALQEPGPRAAVLDFLGEAARRGMPSSVDPGSLSLLEEVGAENFLTWTTGAAMCFPNSDEAVVLAGTTDTDAQLEALCRRYATIVIKRGALGAVAGDASGERRSAPALPADVVDTTGAGDAFLAGFLSARLAGADLAESLRRGCALGAQATGIVGGRPPTESACKGKKPVPS